MDEALRTVGIELIVDDLDRAVELFVEVLGFELISRGPAALVAGEAATIDAAGLVVSLVCPAEDGPGVVLAERNPRLSQIVVGVFEQAAGVRVREAAIDAGLSVSVGDEGNFYVSPESVEGAIGQPVALVFTSLTDP